MDTGLKGKHVLITGASGGIGQAIARCFDEEGSTLSLHYNKNVKGIEELKSSLKGRFKAYKADMTSKDSIRSLFKSSVESHGRIDALGAVNYVIGSGGEDPTDPPEEEPNCPPGLAKKGLC